jgi:hypothetical protein
MANSCPKLAIVAPCYDKEAVLSETARRLSSYCCAEYFILPRCLAWLEISPFACAAAAAQFVLFLVRLRHTVSSSQPDEPQGDGHGRGQGWPPAEKQEFDAALYSSFAPYRRAETFQMLRRAKDAPTPPARAGYGHRTMKTIRYPSRSSGGATAVARSRSNALLANGSSRISRSSNRAVQA